LLVTVLLAPPAIIRVMEGHASFLWTEYYVSLGPGKAPRGGENVTKAAHAAARAIDLAAPLPDAGAAARLCLGLAEASESQNPQEAFEASGVLREALGRVRGPVRGLGLGALEEEARALEERTRRAVSR
jgi:hypothetical protein